MQIAKLMGFCVYATASEKHYEYLNDLGASKVFDYRVANIVDCEGDKGRWSKGSDVI